MQVPAHYSGNLEEVESTHDYLLNMSVNAAIEIDLHLRGKDDDFSCLDQLLATFGRYQLEGNDDEIARFSEFAYWALSKTVYRDSQKELHEVTELALEMRLLRSEMERYATMNRDELAELRDLCVGLSRDFQYDEGIVAIQEERELCSDRDFHRVSQEPSNPNPKDQFDTRNSMICYDCDVMFGKYDNVLDYRVEPL